MTIRTTVSLPFYRTITRSAFALEHQEAPFTMDFSERLRRILVHLCP